MGSSSLWVCVCSSPPSRGSLHTSALRHASNPLTVLYLYKVNTLEQNGSPFDACLTAIDSSTYFSCGFCDLGSCSHFLSLGNRASFVYACYKPHWSRLLFYPTNRSAQLAGLVDHCAIVALLLQQRDYCINHWTTR